MAEPALSDAHAAVLDRTPLPAGSVIDTGPVDYVLDGTALQGYFAADVTSPLLRPGVLVVHDWGGIGEYVRVRAQMLARLGYVALAADIYGADVRPSPAEAPVVAGGYYRDPALTRARVAAGLEQLRAHPLVDPRRIAVIGYCFGGWVALELARSGADLTGVVTFHAALSASDPADAATISGKVLVLSGASDPVVPDEQILAFENEMRAAGVDWQLVRYGGALHAFTQPEVNMPEHGAAYQPAAERRSWTAMRDFFDEMFG
ncbi:dienelactone hydrolase family protein [Nakamurella sp. GG22]